MDTQPTLKANEMSHLGTDVVAIQQAREQLAIKISAIQNRLQSGYSKPLEEHLNDLLKADMRLLCQMTDILARS